MFNVLVVWFMVACLNFCVLLCVMLKQVKELFKPTKQCKYTISFEKNDMFSVLLCFNSTCLIEETEERIL